jgi:hypothetical protein
VKGTQADVLYAIELFLSDPEAISLQDPTGEVESLWASLEKLMGAGFQNLLKAVYALEFSSSAFGLCPNFLLLSVLDELTQAI